VCVCVCVCGRTMHANVFNGVLLHCMYVNVVVNCVAVALWPSEAAPGLPSPGQMEMYEQRAAQTRRYPASVSSSPQKDLQPKVRSAPFYSILLIR